MRLEGQVALVTGAGTGIGRAVALGLAREGAAVGLMGRRSETLARVAEDIAAQGGRSLPLRGDVSLEPDVERSVSSLVESFGRLDILVNNAGVYHQGSALETSPEDWDRVFAVNLRGAWLMARRALTEMLGAHSGVVVNVSSSIGRRPIPNAAAYCASKAGLESLTRALALEVAAEGVRVNAVLPGIVDTPIHESREGFERLSFLSQAGSMHPLGRVGTPEDVASLVIYLVMPEAGWITGALVSVDGGISLA